MRAVTWSDSLPLKTAQGLVDGLRRARPGMSVEAGHAELVQRLGSAAAADAALVRANARLRQGLPIALDQLVRGDYANSPDVVLALDALARRGIR